MNKSFTEGRSRHPQTHDCGVCNINNLSKEDNEPRFREILVH